MMRRSEQAVPEGEAIIPDGPVATRQDMKEFKRLAQFGGFEVKFGQASAVTRPGLKTVAVTPNCTVGVLTDEYLHVWNNFAQARGKARRVAG